MNFYTRSLGVLAAVLSFGALAEGGGDRTFALMMERNEKVMADYAARNGKPAPEVQAYRYGMPLDITKVVSVTPPIMKSQCQSRLSPRVKPRDFSGSSAVIASGYSSSRWILLASIA